MLQNPSICLILQFLGLEICPDIIKFYSVQRQSRIKKS